MRFAHAAPLAAVAAALAAASPAAAVNGGGGISKALHHGSGALVVTAAALDQDRNHSCQAEDRKSHATSKATRAADPRNPTVVACEQPPKSNLLTPDSIAKATAAALATLG
jgi:hypothetical protein